MKAILLASTVLLASCAGVISPAWQESVTITNDRGGFINNYIKKYKRWAAEGKIVIVDGYCASSCTMVVGFIPRSRLCVTKRAIWGFHGAWAPSLSGKQELSSSTHLMTDEYTADIKAWIVAHGGLKTYKTMRIMRWPETANYFRVCGG